MEDQSSGRERPAKRARPSSGTMRIEEVRNIVVDLKKGLDSIEERMPTFANDLKSLKALHTSNERKNANNSDDPVESDHAPDSQPPLDSTQEAPELEDESMSLFRLSSEAMELGFPSCVAHFLNLDTFDGLINLTGVPEVEWAQIDEIFLLNESELKRKASSICTAYDARARLSKPGTGWCFLRQVDDTRIDFPDDPSRIPRPSKTQALASMQRTISNPRLGNITYLIGPFLQQYHVPVESGEKLDNCGVKLPGINAIDVHIGTIDSGLTLRCEEGGLRRFHLTLLGWRAWLRINTADNDKLESLCERYWVSDPRAERCSNWVNHLDLMLSPGWLGSHEIGYDVQVVGPNQMVVIEPKEYYLVLNLSSFLGFSICFLLDNEPIFPDSFVSCPECALYEIEDDGNHRIDDLMKVRGTKRARPAHSDEMAGQSALERISAGILAVEPNCPIPQVLFPIPDREADDNTARLATLVWSRAALRQFVNLVESSGAYSQMEAQPVRGETQRQRVDRRVRNIDIAAKNSMVGMLQQRVAELFFAMDIQRLSKRDKADFRRSVCETDGWTENRIKDVRARGNKWLALCKFHDTSSGLEVSPGLLCFFMMAENPFGIHRDDYLSIQNASQQRAFVDLLDYDNYTAALLAAGNAYVGTFDGTTSVKFQFQKECRKIDWDNEDQATIIRLLSVLDEENYDEDINGEIVMETNGDIDEINEDTDEIDEDMYEFRGDTDEDD
ncbi:hypothetical protein CEP54_014809 [Fusarium duplospermum]|uniref:JmjC domain-containing protein n=1 Tax=Fusarium duplospermum TaxID=1325734 RepID=A0A428NTQ0_9HYPO|nr:hypothetical protein CEP54_014809 [Fusarium duplospermum]